MEKLLEEEQGRVARQMVHIQELESSLKLLALQHSPCDHLV